MLSIIFLAYALISYAKPALSASAVSPASLASQYSLTTSTSLPFPTQTLANTDANNFIVEGWSLSKGRIENGNDKVAFVDDPFPNAPAPGSTDSPPTGPVLQVTYPSGSFQSSTGGVQFYSLWNTSDGSQFDSMLLSYEVAFDSSFNFVKGGKLPGLRGGPQVDGCSGGNAATGSNCFSSRLMWRTSGEGEVYAYIPDSDGICQDTKDFLCNQDGFGTSIDRGSFSWIPGKWNHVTLLIRLNEIHSSNGQVSLFYNNVKAIEQTGLGFRVDDVVSVGGLYFSTFFGGDDPSWATPSTVHSYYRNFQMWGSSAASNLTKTTTSSGCRPTVSQSSMIVTAAAVLGGVMFAYLF